MSSPRSLAHKLTLASGTLFAATALGAFGFGASAGAAPAQQTGNTGESRITQELSITDSSEQTVCDVYSYYNPRNNEGDVHSICRTQNEPRNVVPNCPATATTKPVLTTARGRAKLECTTQGSTKNNVTHLADGQSQTVTPIGHGAPVTFHSIKGGLIELSTPQGTIGKIGPGVMKVNF